MSIPSGAMAKIKSKMAELQSQIENLEEENIQMKRQLNDKDKTICDLQDKEADLTRRVTFIGKDLKSSEERLKQTQSKLEESERGSIKLDNTTREEIGRKCKRLLDYGRIQYLLKHNMTANPNSYIDNNLTPENVVLLATKYFINYCK